MPIDWERGSFFPGSAAEKSRDDIPRYESEIECKTCSQLKPRTWMWRQAHGVIETHCAEWSLFSAGVKTFFLMPWWWDLKTVRWCRFGTCFFHNILLLLLLLQHHLLVKRSSHSPLVVFCTRSSSHHITAPSLQPPSSFLPSSLTSLSFHHHGARI